MSTWTWVKQDVKSRKRKLYKRLFKELILFYQNVLQKHLEIFKLDTEIHGGETHRTQSPLGSFKPQNSHFYSYQLTASAGFSCTLCKPCILVQLILHPLLILLATCDWSLCWGRPDSQARFLRLLFGQPWGSIQTPRQTIGYLDVLDQCFSTCGPQPNNVNIQMLFKMMTAGLHALASPLKGGGGQKPTTLTRARSHNGNWLFHMRSHK